MSNDLIVPSEFPGLHVERNDRAQIEIRARTSFARELRNAIAGHVVHDSRIRICRTHEPHRTAASLPDRIALRPALRSRLTGGWHAEEAPSFLTGLAIQRDDLPAPPVISAEPDRHQTTCVDGGSGNDLPFVSRLIADVLVPHELAGLFTQRHDTRIGEPHEDETISHGHAFTRRTAHASLRTCLKSPDTRAGLRVERIDRRRS